ncbi:hypothetical protein L596_019355 [Steinernema carpocapsae]|uniref:G-protein coupled receptors family 1 profile domain-containing protein n=1 Tax=Steinernema carpocapsae TaxID=34508 RepID=A0A4U5MQG6_STECR|nr:hypothetical protein L596_019355 [Steinernema carpocapsae]
MTVTTNEKISSGESLSSFGEGEMWVGIALIEHFLAAFLNFSTTIVVSFIIKQKSLAKLWQDSPPLLGLILASLTCATTIFVTNVQWILVSLQYVSKIPKFTAFLHFPGVIAISSGWFYDLATIGVCLQRVLIVARPFNNRKLGSIVLVCVTTVVAIISMATYLTFNIVYTSIEVSPANKSSEANLIFTYEGIVRLLCAGLHVLHDPMITKVARFYGISLSLGVVLSGVIFRIVLTKFNKRFMLKSFQKKVNRYTLCVLCVRLILVFIPKLIDDVLRSTADIKLGMHIGPYGAVGGAVDNFACIVVYFVMLRKMQADVRSST